ncbi:TRAP transporter large permease [Maritimibacter alkaliphilus]|uniref:TRAP transporter large permease n=1 Tax=Maritimibacter alkaliphilus TaxID=404236 RepID=UPI001C95539B|nr:TRAP transporter large permease [Maritimibacter alkaliphilus]MBY6092641.1 TRAP transporter large permease [Maritimibacter alkaliphilus]
MHLFGPISVVLLFVSGLGLAYSIGAGSVLAFFMVEKSRFLALMPQTIFSKIDVFALMAMPLFILAGEIMNRGGITKILIRFSMALVGRLPGALGSVNILTSVFFAGISGSAVADSAALSNTLVPAMRDQGYSRTYASAITAASSVIGPIVPPSIIMIFYGAIMGTSVAGMFIAGIIPGLLLAASLLIMNTFFAIRHGHPRLSAEDRQPILPALIKALPALSLPIIIVGGIVFGWMTPTEAAALAVLVALGASAIYERLSIATLIEAFQKTAILSGSIFIILCAVAVFGHLISLEGIPEALAALVTDLDLGPVQYLLVLNLILVLCGMFLDIPVALALVVPLFAPVALANGMDPVHLGIVVCFNLCIGLITPPLGSCLLIVSSITGENYWKLSYAALPFVIVEYIVLGLLVAFPEISLWLPSVTGIYTPITQ